MKQETILKIEITRSETGQLSVWTEKTGKEKHVMLITKDDAAKIEKAHDAVMWSLT
jgi:hypothetical protein